MSSTFPSCSVPNVLIVSPALADANNGNWHTASRWARLLEKHCRIGIAAAWDGTPPEVDLLIALHARRSAPSIDAWARARPGRPLVVVLTGTDLYRDIVDDAAAQRSLEQATHFVVLQDEGPDALPAAARAKCAVIHQSAPALAPTDPPGRTLRIVSVGHLRAEKDPETFMRAALRLAGRADVRFEQIGSALEPALAHAAEATARQSPSYRWLGGMGQADARERIRTAHLFVNTSRMEGGAQAILEAARSATAVLASDVPGNRGMLGRGHQGLFEVGDDAGLASLIERAADDRGFLARLRAETCARAPLFDPAEEERRLVRLVFSALCTTPR